jgi:hypothetical protein
MEREPMSGLQKLPLFKRGGLAARESHFIDQIPNGRIDYPKAFSRF